MARGELATEERPDPNIVLASDFQYVAGSDTRPSVSDSEEGTLWRWWAPFVRLESCVFALLLVALVLYVVAPVLFLLRDLALVVKIQSRVRGIVTSAER